MTLIGLSGKISLISASDYNVEERAYFYLNRFESSLQNYTDITTYEQLDSNINKEYQQLEKSLIREIEGLSHLYTDSSVFDRDKNKVDKLWIGGANKLISKFKTKWIAKREVEKVVENRQTPVNIGTKLSGLYDDLLLKFSGMDLSGVEFFNSYRENAGKLAKNELGEYNQWLNTELEAVQDSMADKYSNISIDSINEQMKIEKSSAIYKQKRYISLILNRSLGEKFSEVAMDNRSLRQQMEKAHAEKVSREIENSINKELSENIRSKLDNILSGAEKEINSESELTSVLKDFYKKGLEIWAVGAGKLVAKENEWFRNYNDIYNEGTDAWTAALTVLQDKKNQWMREYSDIVEQGLNDWESNLNEMYLSKDELINNLDEYIRSKETAFDSYLNNLSVVMETGKDKVAELDGYKEEIELMIQHVLDPIEGRKLSFEEVRLYNRLINKYKNDEDEFYKYNRDLDTIFDLKTTHIKISKASRRDKLVGNPNYSFMGSVPINNGFSIYVCVENYVKRYKKAFTLKGLRGFYFKVSKEGLEKRYYRIDYHYNNKGEWYKTYSPISENSDRSIKVRPNLKEINSSLGRYVNLIETLNREKTSLLTSIIDTQNSVVEQISSNNDILENQLFTDRAGFEKYFFGDNELKKNIKKLGFSLDEITDVIITHLHDDHIGGAVEYNKNKELEIVFKNADFWISKQQWDWAVNPNKREVAAYFPENFMPLKKSGRLHLINEENEYIENIYFKIYNGHTQGQIIPVITYKNKKIIFMADFIPSVFHIPIPYVAAVDIQPLLSLKEKEEFLNQAVENGYILFFEHDYYHECCSLKHSKKGIVMDKHFLLKNLI